MYQFPNFVAGTIAIAIITWLVFLIKDIVEAVKEQDFDLANRIFLCITVIAIGAVPFGFLATWLGGIILPILTNNKG